MHSYNRNPFERETHIGYAKTLHFNTKTTYLDSVIGTKAGTEQYKGGGGDDMINKITILFQTNTNIIKHCHSC